MARFYGSIQGNRGESTRMGSKGFVAHIRGWDFGIKVYCNWDSINGQEIYEVYTTGGSNNGGTKELIGKFKV